MPQLALCPPEAARRRRSRAATLESSSLSDRTLASTWGMSWSGCVGAGCSRWAQAAASATSPKHAGGRGAAKRSPARSGACLRRPHTQRSAAQRSVPQRAAHLLLLGREGALHLGARRLRQLVQHILLLQPHIQLGKGAAGGGDIAHQAGCLKQRQQAASSAGGAARSHAVRGSWAATLGHPPLAPAPGAGPQCALPAAQLRSSKRTYAPPRRLPGPAGTGGRARRRGPRPRSPPARAEQARQHHQLSGHLRPAVCRQTMAT